MTYKGNQIDYGNLNDNLKTKIDKAEGVESQVQALTPKVDNSWQKGVYNDTDIINVGELNTSRVFHIKNWDAPTGNVEKVSIVIPAEIFSGTVKVSVTSEWGHTNGTGAFEYETSYSKSGNDVHLHNRTIYKADQNIATECYFPDFDRNNSLFSIPIVRKPNAKNWLSVKIELLTIYDSFDILKLANIVYEDLGASWTGYPWAQQTSNIPTKTQIDNWYQKQDSVVVDKSIGNTYPDPNTFLDTTFITNHANAQSGGTVQFWYIEQVFYGDNKANNARSQFARSYLGNADMKVRRYHPDTGWSPWSPSIQEVFQSASDLKTNVAQAITDKGIQTSPNATGAQMAANIRAIQTSNSYGTVASIYGNAYFITVDGSSGPALIPFVLLTIPFKPKMINVQTILSGVLHSTVCVDTFDGYG